ncbi:hypothetical protein GQ457_07G030590 [Hibiscus cannabinus]
MGFVVVISLPLLLLCIILGLGFYLYTRSKARQVNNPQIYGAPAPPPCAAFPPPPPPHTKPGNLASV